MRSFVLDRTVVACRRWNGFLRARNDSGQRPHWSDNFIHLAECFSYSGCCDCGQGSTKGIGCGGRRSKHYSEPASDWFGWGESFRTSEEAKIEEQVVGMQGNQLGTSPEKAFVDIPLKWLHTSIQREKEEKVKERGKKQKKNIQCMVVDFNSTGTATSCTTWTGVSVLTWSCVGPKTIQWSHLRSGSE